MKNSEVLNELLRLTEENARFKAALELVKESYKANMDKGYSFNEEKQVLMVAGLLDKEVELINLDREAE